ncbi:zinc-ribbon domain-containing protein [Clostridium sp. MCC353]|uniref:zinc ribbon domain-containing protein n=1 Tax=Clostridium sp. MCC353 TaxID=2592646 RepID=UPI001C01DEE8|nr:zinc ribbon domain-containing protein [Clostridium sp. MCC353]MBT9775612.1 zinc-ribbon domain-containing protein [Clostridium sp. MCC353]
MKCPNCNMENDENAKFCTSCGNRLIETRSQAENASEKDGTADQAKKDEKTIMPDLTERKIDWDSPDDKGKDQEGAAQQNGAVEDVAQADMVEEEPAVKDVAQADTVEEEPAVKDVAQADAVEEEPAVKDVAQADAVEEEPAVKDVAQADAVVQEPAKKDVAQEETARESVNEEAAVENAGGMNSPSAGGIQTNTPEAAAPGNTTPVVQAPVINSQADVVSVPKKKKGKGIIIAAAAAVAVVGIAAAVFFGMQKDPKEEVFNAFKSVNSSEQVKPVEEIFGFGDIFANAQTASTDYGFGLTLEKDMGGLGLSSFEGAGFDIFEKNDLKNNIGSLDLGILYKGIDITTLKMYYDDTYFKASIPDLFDQVFVLNYAEDLAGQIENSPYLGQYIDMSGIDMDAFQSYMEYCQSLYAPGSTGPIDVLGLKERFNKETKSFDKLKDSIKVSKISKKKNFKVDGSDVSCRGFGMVVSKDNLLDFVDETCQFFLEDETLKQELIDYYSQIMNMSNQMMSSSIYGDPEVYDGETMVNEMWDEMNQGIEEVITALDSAMDDEIEITVYLDKKGRLISLEAETGLTNEDDSTALLGLNLEFNGGSYLTQNMNAVFTVEADGEKGEITFVKEGKYDDKTLTCDVDLGLEFDDELVEIAYSGSYDRKNGDYDLMLAGSDDGSEIFKVSVAGVIEDLEKGKGFRADADTISISSEGMKMLELSGYYSIAPMDGEIEDLEGTEFDVLGATENEWGMLIMSAYGRVMGLLSKFE